MLDSMQKRWHKYVSIYETEIIEHKLEEEILKSFTFKFSRQPESLSLIPDRVTDNSMRLAHTVKVINN